MTFEERLRTVINDSETLAHYGVLGMKWGVRKDPKKAYQKGVKKLRKLERNSKKRISSLRNKANKEGVKIAKQRGKVVKWIKSMEDAFSNIDVSAVNKNDVDYVKNWIKNNNFEEIRLIWRYEKQ